MNTSTKTCLVLVAMLFVLVRFSSAQNNSSTEPIKIGWIGAITGGAAKYGAYEAAQLAATDINERGGVGGRKLELSFQDGRCNARDALVAAHQLVDNEKLEYLVGGHCSTESLVIAPVASRAKVVTVAAITSSPKFSDAGDTIFRVTAPNSDGVKKLIDHSRAIGARRIAIIFEETEYAQGLGETFRALAESAQLGVAVTLSYQTGEGDFRSIATRIKASTADTVYVSVQAPDAAVGIMRALSEQGIVTRILGNEIFGNAVQSAGSRRELFEGVVFAEPMLDENEPRFRAFRDRYLRRTGLDELPSGYYTAEAYDAVAVLADAISVAGDNPIAVAAHLRQTPAYEGVSGIFRFDEHGDGVRNYVLKRVAGGAIEPLAEALTTPDGVR